MTLFIDARYGKMGYVARFHCNLQNLQRLERCVLKTDRGLELGITLSTPKEDPQGRPITGDVIRVATDEDIALADGIEKQNRLEESSFCKEQIQKLALPMKFVEVDHLIGGEKIVFYFTSETRVDFRELVKILVAKYRTHIELRQIGARDYTRICGGCGSCGLPLCCNMWRKELGGITFDMARIQFDNPEQQKLLGPCGRLKCCLKYEYEGYLEAIKLLPNVGTRVNTAKGTGTVIARNLSLRLLTIQKDDGERLCVSQQELI